MAGKEEVVVQHSQDGASLFSLRMFFIGGLHFERLNYPDDLEEALPLTPRGQEAFDILSQFLSDVAPEELRFITFLLFSHGEPLIDFTRAQIGQIESFLDESVRNMTIRFPYLYGKLLYDRAFDLFYHPHKLDGVATAKLLDSTPQGVCQYGLYIAGDAGLLMSSEPRYIAPQTEIPLWHCKNLMCGYFHSTTLTEPYKTLRGSLNLARTILNKKLESVNVPLADYMDALRGYRRYYDDFWPADLCAFLGNAFSNHERASIASGVLDKHRKTIRNKEINRNAILPKTVLASNGKVNHLGSTALQLALLATDDNVIACVDELVLGKVIQIPETEIRTSKATPPKTWQSVRCECSDLGFRLHGAHSQLIPLARLKRLVLALKSGKDSGTLLWILRKVPGKSVGEKLENFIISHDPIKVIETFVLENPESVTTTLHHLHANHIILPEGDAQEKKFLEIILWKLGFPKTTFRSPVESFRNRLSLFRESAAATFGNEEQWKAQVRSVGVNLFVSLEEVLDRALAFSTWLLLADHVKENHSFNLRVARALTAKELSGLITTDRGPVDFNPNGKNTLFSLGTCFAALCKRISSLLSLPLTTFEKPESHLAFFARKSNLQIFPFKHSHFVLDMEEGDRKRTLELLHNVSTRVASSRVLQVRNNIPHLSELFPTRDEIKECCQVLEQTVDELEEFGLLPVLFVTSKMENDSWQRRTVKALDYKGRFVIWSVSPSTTCLHDVPNPSSPQIIVPAIRLPETAEPMRFSVAEDSNFSDIWKDFPRRKFAETTDGIGHVSELATDGTVH